MNYNDDATKEELRYAEFAKAQIDKITKARLSALSDKRDSILDERKYFIDYFYELKEDERRDLIENEFLDTKNYEKTLSELAILSKQKNEPYFARFDFTEKGYESEKFYIGIHTVTDPETMESCIYDWRAPISSLYYEFEPGEVTFQTPGGDISGDLTTKRRYVFKKGELKTFSDINMPSDDEVLVDILSRKSSDHMKTILQSIQADQHKIIRDYVEGTSVIQGCPGSGKSSIALHKAAYVLYKFRERLERERIAIISPNPVFSEYISTVLPDLGEENIDTLTPEEIVRDLLEDEEQTDFLGRAETNELYIRGKRPDAFVKNQEQYRADLLEFVDKLKNIIFEPADIILENEDIAATKEDVKRLFYKEFSYLPLLSRGNEIADRICENAKLESLVDKEYVQTSVMGMYKYTYISEIYNLFLDERGHDGEFIWEDGCAMALLRVILKEVDENNVFYLIADEAQDFSPVFLDILNRIFKGSNFLFVGDRNQIVFESSGDYISDIERIMRKRPFRKYELTTNYRSTAEIMGLANEVIGKDASESNCVRHGDAPFISECSSADAGKKVSECVCRLKDKDYENITILCKLQSEVNDIKSRLEIPYAVENSINLRILPVSLAKGLEFDAAIVWDEAITNDDKNIIYTAITRAMHDVAWFKIG